MKTYVEKESEFDQYMHAWSETYITINQLFAEIELLFDDYLYVHSAFFAAKNDLKARSSSPLVL